MAIDNQNNINKAKFNSLDYWKDEIRAGIRYRTVYGKTADWKKYKNMYRGFWQKGVVPVNIMYAVARSLIPQVYFRNPRVGVVARKPGFSMHARVVERIDNYIIHETGLKNELKSLVLDTYLCGRGPGILGYDTEFGFNPSFQTNDNYAIDGSLTSFSKTGERIEYTDNVKPGMPWFMRCNPMDFIIPWGTYKWEDARWFAFRKMRMLRDIKEDPKYKNKNNLKAPYVTRIDGGEGKGEAQQMLHEGNARQEWVELWQIHDKRSGRVFVLSLDHSKFLRDEFDFLQVEGLPGDVLGFNEDPDYFWWPPDARMIERQQDELNDIRTMAQKHRRVALLKILYDKGLVGKDELSKLLDGDVKAAIAIDAGPNGDVRKSVALLQSHVPPDFSIAAKEVREDVREVVGFSRNQMGSFEDSSGRRTAHEAEIVRAASMIRIHERRDVMSDYLTRIIRKENQLIFENWTAERVVDIVGEDGARYWIKFTGPEIRGEFSYKINPEESLPSDRGTKRAEAEKFMEIALKVPGMNMKYLMETYAAEFEWIDPHLLFPGEGPGRSPENAMQFRDFAQGQAAQSSFPGLAG